jgi:hypothetical protein
VAGAVVSKNRLENVSFAKRGICGGTIGDGMDDCKSNTKEVTFPECAIPLLFNVPKEIDHSLLDVEGAETWILSSFPLDSCSFKITHLHFQNLTPKASWNLMDVSA